MDYLTDEEVRAHARDAENHGVLSPHKHSFLFQGASEMQRLYVPRIETKLFEWDFSQITGSDSSGEFVFADISSGSSVSGFAPWITDDRYGPLRIVRNQYTGMAKYFPASSTQVVNREYIYSAKQDMPEVINSSDMISILGQDDLVFTKESRPIDYFYAVEKSMYRTISNEMMKMFATIKDFNSLIGNPVNYYRHTSKEMDKLKSLFFESVENEPDLDRYVEFYKWIDGSISKFLEQLFPASANYSENLRTIIENHLLERNKYRGKFPTLEMKQQDPESTLLGIRELKYDWKYGHAPIVSEETDKCLWWNQRAERTNPTLSSSVASVNADKSTILDVATTDVSGSYLDRVQGSTYVLRKLSRPYKDGVEFSKQIHGGVNFAPNKKKGFWKDVLRKGTQNSLTLPYTYVADEAACLDKSDTKYKWKMHERGGVLLDDDGDGVAITSETDVPYVKGNIVLPFSTYTTSSTKPTAPVGINSVRWTNIHDDSYGTLNEVPMQGPFTEKYVGGNQHRHVRINDGSDLVGSYSKQNRPEAWNYTWGGSAVIIRIHSDVNSGAPDAKYYRDFIAKRPVNIKNILQTTASVDVHLSSTIQHGPIGNYSKQYQMVQTSGRKANNKYFAEAQGVGFGFDPRSGTGNSSLINTPEVSAFYNSYWDFQLPDRSVYDTVFVERFSAPGSFEVLSRGYLDPFAEEYSAYNAMPWRNWTVRGPRYRKPGWRRNTLNVSASIWSTASLGLRSLLTRHVSWGGYDHEASTTGAFHKTNRNRLRRMEMSGEFTYYKPDGTTSRRFTTGSVYDNGWITHVIPQSDYQYQWITSSIFGGAPEFASAGELILGYFPQSGEVSGASGFNSAINFVSSSATGAYQPGGLIKTDFIGLNSVVLNTITDNTLETTASTDLYPANKELKSYYLLNSINLNRNGPYQHPSWKQIRSGDTPVARHHKKNNTISIFVREPTTGDDTGLVAGDATYTMFGVDVMPSLGLSLAVTGKNNPSYKELQGHLHTLARTTIRNENYTEPMVSRKFYPMRHTVQVMDNNLVTDLVMDHTYANNLAFFANPQLETRVNYAGFLKEPGDQTYDYLKDMYLGGTIPVETNPIKGFKNLVYRETIHPKHKNTYLAESRGRVLYTESALSMSARNLGSQRTFWRSADVITREGTASRYRVLGTAKNAFGVSIDDHGDWSGETATEKRALDLSVWPLDSVLDTTLTKERYSRLTGTLNGQLSLNTAVRSTAQAVDGVSGVDGIPTASFCYEYHNFVSCSVPHNHSGASIPASPQLLTDFIPEWTTAQKAGAQPWDNSYEEYANDIRSIGQEYTVLPEFRVSQHMDYYLENGEDSFFQLTNNSYLTLEGAELSQSAPTPQEKLDEDFFITYTNSDFLKHFEVIRAEHDGLADFSEITLRCHAIKKLLPYNGFYPMLRTVQMASLFSQSYAPMLGLGGSSYYSSDVKSERLSAYMQPYFAPGILYNSIKSGIACDWLAFTGSTVTDVRAGANVPSVIVNDSSSYRIPFEAILDPAAGLPSDLTRNYMLDTLHHTGSEPHATGVFGSFAASALASAATAPSLTGEIPGTPGASGASSYSLAMSNFLSEVPNFFLNNRTMTSWKSELFPADQKFEFKRIAQYNLRLDLEKTPNMVMYEGPFRVTGSGDAQTTIKQARGIHYGPFLATGSATGADAGSLRYDPAPAPYTPPYFYGRSSFYIGFKPDTVYSDSQYTSTGGDNVDSNDSISMTLPQFVNLMKQAITGAAALEIEGTNVQASYYESQNSPTVTYFNSGNLDLSNVIGNATNGLLYDADGNVKGELPGFQHTIDQEALCVRKQMYMNASFNLFDLVYEPMPNGQLGVRWVMSTKYEFPVLNFAGTSGSFWPNASNNVDYHTRGMWRGYGADPYNKPDDVGSDSGGANPGGSPFSAGLDISNPMPQEGDLRQT